MKKSTGLVSVLVVAGIAYTGVSWYVGQQAEKVIQQTVVSTNDNFRKAMVGSSANEIPVLRIDRFERGIFSSMIDYTLVIPNTSEAPVEIRLADQLSHGPFPWMLISQGSFSPVLAASTTRLLPTPFTQKWINTQKDGQSPLVINTRVAFNNDTTAVMHFKPVDSLVDGENLVFSGGTISIDWKNNFLDNQVKGGFDSLSFEDKNEQSAVRLSQIAIQHDATQAGDQIKVGGSLGVKRAVIQDAELEQDIIFDNTALVYNSIQKGDLLDADMRYDFGSVKMGTTDFGSLALGARAANVDAQQLMSLLTLIDTIDARQNQDNSLDLTPEEEAALMASIKAVIATKPSFALDPVVWKTAQGESSALATLQLVTPTADPVGQDLTPDEFLLHAIQSFDLRLKVSRPMLVGIFTQLESNPENRAELQAFANMMFDGYVSNLESAGLATLQGDTAQTELVFSNNELKVNGKLMHQEELLGVILQLLF